MGCHTKEQYVKYAQEYLTVEGEIEVDDDALVSMGDDPGAYVQAWVWVNDYDIKEVKNEH